MKKLVCFLISVLLLSNISYANGVDTRSVLRFHNGSLDKGTNTTDPVDHGHYVPSLYDNYYFNNTQFPMFIAFTLIVSDGSYGPVINVG